jgi:phosphatidylserine decarboxylase
MSVARAGVPIIFTFLMAHLVCLGLSWMGSRLCWSCPLQFVFPALALLTGLFTVFSLYFFRDPERVTPAGDQLVVSPADGKVLAIEQVEEPDYIKGPALKISIFMSVFSVHVNRYPVSGTVEYRCYRPGKFFNAEFDKASRFNEAMSLGIVTGDGRKVLVRQIAGLIARRIVCPVAEGAKAVCGERYGMIRFGSRLEVFLPTDTKTTVSSGMHVSAGESVLAELP